MSIFLHPTTIINITAFSLLVCRLFTNSEKAPIISDRHIKNLFLVTAGSPPPPSQPSPSWPGTPLWPVKEEGPPRRQCMHTSVAQGGICKTGLCADVRQPRKGEGPPSLDY